MQASGSVSQPDYGSSRVTSQSVIRREIISNIPLD
jgi:hypothetical protein